MRDGKSKFFKGLNLDSETKKLIRAYRKFKPYLLDERPMKDYATEDNRRRT